MASLRLGIERNDEKKMPAGWICPPANVCLPQKNSCCYGKVILCLWLACIRVR